LSNQELTLAINTFELMTATFSQMLPALKNILSKAEASCVSRNIDPQVMLTGRLAPDMFDLTRQVQITTDQVKGGMARLAGAEVPSWPDDETSFGDLAARIDKALAFMSEFSPEQFDDAETRKIELKFPNASFEFVGKEYLLGFVLPNFYFHMTTAYAILRHSGVDIGKRDFLGG
jgi:hypothetical protein